MIRTICAVLVFALSVAACTDDDEATEVVIVIDADREVRDQSSGLRLQVESLSDGDDASVPDVEDHDGVHWPFKLALTPRDGDAARKYRVTAEAVDTQGDRVAAARIVSGFVAGERRRVRIVIEAACIDVDCQDNQTCHLQQGAGPDADGSCTNAHVDPEDLGHGETPDLGDLLDDPPGDAGGDDAGPDDASMDGAADDAGPDDAGGQPDACGANNGGCDPLSACMPTQDGFACGACPTGFAGDGESGCVPRLLDLMVSPGELLPAFAVDMLKYDVRAPLTAERIAITAHAEERVTISIAGAAVTSGEAWTSGVLAAGASALAIEVGVETGTGESYELAIARGRQQAYVKAANTDQNDHFGGAVAVFGETMVIGAQGEDSASVDDPLDDALSSSGAAYVFVRNGDDWAQVDYLKADNADAQDAFGYAVAISGDTIVVGAPLEDSSALGVNGDGSLDDVNDSGAAYVFVRDGDGWSQQAYLKASNTDNTDWFGSSVAIDRDTIVVGALYESSNAAIVDGPGDNDSAPQSGAAYVFVRQDGSWSQQAYLKPENNGNGHLFGTCVAAGVGGTLVAVGAPGDNDVDSLGRGSAYVFTREGGDWMQTVQLKARAASPGQAFGYSVAMSGDTVAVGTSSDDVNAAQQNGAAGAVHVFEGDDGFVASHRLVASYPDPGDNFGESVAIDGDVLVVGALREAGSAFGIHPSAGRADNSAIESGAGYVFTRNATGWTSLAYIKARNAESSDHFGVSVAVSQGTLAIGAIRESSGATGVNAGADAEADNAAPASGAVYVFH